MAAAGPACPTPSHPEPPCTTLHHSKITPAQNTQLLSATVRDFINFTGHAKLKRKIGHAAKANKS